VARKSGGGADDLKKRVERQKNETFIDIIGKERGEEWKAQNLPTRHGAGFRGVVDAVRSPAFGKNKTIGKEKTVAAWEDEMKFDHARRRGSVGVWNPKTGRREGGRR